MQEIIKFVAEARAFLSEGRDLPPREAEALVAANLDLVRQPHFVIFDIVQWIVRLGSVRFAGVLRGVSRSGYSRPVPTSVSARSSTLTSQLLPRIYAEHGRRSGGSA
jgi:hypothetical protein